VAVGVSDGTGALAVGETDVGDDRGASVSVGTDVEVGIVALVAWGAQAVNKRIVKIHRYRLFVRISFANIVVLL
jgi:hypothetical protein